MEQIYKEYSNLVYHYLISLCKNDVLAEELLQETFYKAIKNINKFNNTCKVSTWLCQIAKNTCIDFLRKEKKYDFVSISEYDYHENLIADEPFENQDKIISLYKYIDSLDNETKQVFYLRLKSELSFKEIGKILNKSENWARTVFYRGKTKLKEKIKIEK